MPDDLHIVQVYPYNARGLCGTQRRADPVHRGGQQAPEGDHGNRTCPIEGMRRTMTQSAPGLEL